MENLKLLIEALEKGIKHSIYNNLEIMAIQTTLEKLSNELESTKTEENEVKDIETE